MSRQLPRSLEIRDSDDEKVLRTRVMAWARDVVRILRALPSVEYVTLDVPSSPDRYVAVDARPRAVSVAQVLSGSATGAPGIAWAPEQSGFRITALHGFSGDARLVLRVEV